ncbi:MAG: hypothetical protein QM644_00115 [Mobilitalea sp.]
MRYVEGAELYSMGLHGFQAFLRMLEQLGG